MYLDDSSSLGKTQDTGWLKNRGNSLLDVKQKGINPCHLCFAKAMEGVLG